MFFLENAYKTLKKLDWHLFYYDLADLRIINRGSKEIDYFICEVFSFSLYSRAPFFI